MGNFNGIPYYEPIQRLNQAFPNPKPGETLPGERLRMITQCEDSRHQAIIAAWMKQLRKRGLKPTRQGKARGVGIWFATERDETHLVDNGIIHHAKRGKRLFDRSNAIDPKDFTEDENKAHNLRKLNLARNAVSEAEAAKDARRAPPPPASGANVRMFKKA
jgi:hypothetical protein